MEVENNQPTPARFELERRLGSGGFGSVFVALDTERGQRVALKRLERLDPGSIYRFKQEFRALADVSHPNLVKLYELFAHDSSWSFTMELVSGVPFDLWVRGEEGSDRDAQSTEPDAGAETAPSNRSHVTPADGGDQLTTELSSFNPEKLQDALAQLIRGVAALHAEGILHRDLKPSNVLVDERGRVVILDFGMVATGVVDSHQSVDGATAGTPAYMSPEQARGAPLTMASDWYAVGLMLYEALTGHLPFGGTPADILAAKASRDARSPKSLDPSIPDDLNDLCVELLRRDPGARPAAHQIMDRLQISASSVVGKRPHLAGAFVGRHKEYEKLQASFQAARSGKTVVAHVHGPSGHGKSTLIRHFLNQIALHDEVVILDGRCYERESVPFKALDDLVDGLYRYLRRLRPVEAATFMPRHAAALLRLFPTLGRLDFMLSLPGKAPPTDPHELRRKAFQALREMFTRLTDTRPLVLFIDDVQWGDSDSAALFRDVLAPPDVPPLLLIVGYRGDAPQDNELLRTLKSPRAADAAWHTVDVPLGPLTQDDARELAAMLLGTDAPDGLADTVATESGGSPLFVAELARRARTGLGRGGVTLQGVVAERIVALPESTRLVLDIMTCSDRPLDQGELERACSLESEELMCALDQLREEQLVSVSTNRGRAAFEILHDKLRLAVSAGLSEERLRRCHSRLAISLAEMGQTDPETVAYHFTAANDLKNALSWTQKAAERALDGVAFEHVVTLLQRAKSFAADDERPAITKKLAAALARAGRGGESAEAYLEAAMTSSGEEASNLRQAAAEQYLRSGHVEQALSTFGPLLEDAGLALPKTPTAALISLLWKRSVLRWRGLNFKERPVSEIDKDKLRAIDFCWSVGTGLAGIDLVRSARYQVISLHMSLKCGDTYRISRSLSIEAIMKALESTEGVRLATILAQRSTELAEQTQNSHALGWATAARAVVAWGNTDLPLCLKLSDEAIASLRQRSLETFREIGSMQVWFALNSTFLMGDLRRLAERAPACAREAEARGDRYTLSTVRGYILPYLWASRDRVDLARKEADAAVSVWPEDIWYHQHWAWLKAMCFLDLYEGDGQRAFERATKHRADMKRAMQLRVRTLRSELFYLEARAAVELLLKGDRKQNYERLILDRARSLEAEDNKLSTAYAALLRAGLAGFKQNDSIAAFANVEAMCEQLKMPMHAAAARLRQGQCTGGAAGQQMIDQARARLEKHTIVDPLRFADMLVPTVRCARA